jgi:phosphotransferase system  glucose/maltose/N-acetylglucosamine-specific IIC component
VFEIILLIAATAGITSLARGRGGNPWLWGTLTVVGYFLVPGLIGFLWHVLKPAPMSRDDAQLLFFIVAIAWVAVLAFCARFILGAKYAKPEGMWSCPHCSYLNQPYAVICEACRQPYGTKPQPAS